MFFRTISTVFSFIALGVVAARAAPYPVGNLSRRSTLTFGGKERQVGPLSDAYQVYKDQGGKSYAISAGYEDTSAGNTPVPAVLVSFERPEKADDGTEPEARQAQNKRVSQIKAYATAAKQFLAYDNSNDEYLFLVLRNPEKDFPTSGSSPLKMFHQLYNEDTSMNVTAKLLEARELGHLELMRLANENKIMYNNYGIKSALMDSGFTRIAFFDWKPQISKAKPGIVEISRQDESTETTEYEAMLKKDNKGFTISDLKKLLAYENESLREADKAAWKVEYEAAKAAQRKATEDAQHQAQPVTKRNKRLS